MAAPIPLTEFQAGEVGGLMDVYVDEGWPAWAVLRGRDLEVLDPAEAIEEIEQRIDWFLSESPKHGSNPASAVRSLRKLVEQIERSSPDT